MFERWQSLPPNRVFDDKEGNRYIIPYDIGSRVKDEVVSSRDFIKLSATELLFDYYGISRPPGKKYKIEGAQARLIHILWENLTDDLKGYTSNIQNCKTTKN